MQLLHTHFENQSQKYFLKKVENHSFKRKIFCDRPRSEKCHTVSGKNYSIVENVTQYTNGNILIRSTQYW